MKTIAIILSLMLSPLAFSQDDFDLQNLEYLQVKGREGESTHVRCFGDDVMVGMRHKNSGDESIVGMWCDSAPFLISGKDRFIEVNNFSGRDYDVKCHNDEFMSGVNFSNDLDDSIEGIYCRKLIFHTLQSEFYVSFYEGYSLESLHDEFCPEGSVVSGVRFHKSHWDDTTSGFFCNFVDSF